MRFRWEHLAEDSAVGNQAGRKAESHHQQLSCPAFILFVLLRLCRVFVELLICCVGSPTEAVEHTVGIKSDWEIMNKTPAKTPR